MQNHVFQIEKLRKITLYGVLLLLVLILTLILLFQTSYIQTKITNFFTKEISEQLNSKINIDNVKFSLFRGFVFDGIYIEDQQSDTLLYVKHLSIIPKGFQIDINNISLREIKINSMYLNLYSVGKDSLNIKYLLDALYTNNSTNLVEDFMLISQNFSIKNSRFKYNVSDTIKNNGFDFKNLKIDNLNINLKNFLIKNEDIVSEIMNVSFKEESGFVVLNVNSKKAHFNPQKIHLKSFTFQTPQSNLVFDSLNFNFPSKYDISEFKTKLKSEVSIKKGTYLSYEDVRYFIADTINNYAKIDISGYIKGTYDNFKVSKLSVKYEDIFALNLNSEIKGLKHLKNLSGIIKIRTLYVNLQKLKSINFPQKDKILNSIPNWAEEIDNINFSGITKGKLSYFTTEGLLFGNFGSLSVKTLTKKDSFSVYNVKGNVSGKELRLSSIVKDKNLGTITFLQDFDFSYFKNKKIKLQTSGIIEELIYKNHSYKDISLYANMFDNKFDSINVSIDQPYIRANVFGNINLSSSVPEVNLIADVKNVNVSAIKLFKTSHKYSTKFKLATNFKGINLNDFEGSIKLMSPLIYKKDTSTVIVDKFFLTSNKINNVTEEKVIILSSDIVDAKIVTYKDPNITITRLKNLVDNILKKGVERPTSTTIDTLTSGAINLEVNIKQADVLMSFFSSDYYISNNTKIYGFYDPDKNNINISFNSKIFKYKKLIVTDFYIILYTKENKFFGGVGGSSIKPNNSIYAENINFEGEISGNKIGFNLNWNNFKDVSNYSANISGRINIKRKENGRKYYDCALTNSEMNFNDIIWKFNDANIIIDSTKISVIDLILRNKDQKVYFDGNISEYQGDMLFVEYENFNISNIQPAIHNKLVINGKLNGSTTFAQLYNKPLIFTKDSIINLNINKIDFGNFYFKSNWDNKNNKIHVNAYNLKGRYKKFMNDTIYGDYWPNTGNVNFTTEVRSMLLKTFEEYYSELASFNSTAFVKGKVLLYGNYKSPKVVGDLKLKQVSTLIKYLNTNYSVSEMGISFDNSNITINKTKIYSSNKRGIGFIKGNVSHDFFSNYNLDIDIDADNLQLMNIDKTENSYFYGNAYGTGNINISGPTKKIHLDANLITEKETSIYIPMNSNRVLEEEKSFIRFVSNNTTSGQDNKQEENYNADLGGFSMNMKVDITPDAGIRIIPDENGYIATNGEGSINMTLNSEEDFNMFGTYIISKGDYKLNIRQLSKTFKIQDGGKIIWAGDPEDAIIDITGIYPLYNITLNNLLPSEEEEAIEKAKVNCSVILAGTLLDPQLKLGVDFPENVSAKYSSKLSSLDTKSINEQFLSLLVIKRFLTSTGTDFNDAKPVTGDLLTSQLNSMLNKLNSGIDMSLKYNPGQETLTDEYGFEVSGTILDDRVSLKGGVGIGGNEVGGDDIGEKKEKFVGEGEAEIKLNKKGNIRAKIYNKANDKFDNDGNYTQGAGIVWRQKFDSFFFWRRSGDSNGKDSIK